MPATQIRGIQLVYDDFGNGQPIVFIHGHPFNRSMWKAQAEYFRDHYRLIVPDLRGYGESGVTVPKVMLDEMALDVIHLMDELQVERAVFCGLSMGGQILLDLYRLFPHRVKALVIADSDAAGETAETKRARLVKADSILQTGMIRHTEDTIHEYISATSLQDPNIYHPLYEMMSNTSPQGAAAAHRGRADRRNHTPILSSIRVPTLVIVGSEDFFTPLPVAKMMSDAIPGARLVCIQGAGHLPNMEASTAFNVVVNDFLSGLD